MVVKLDKLGMAMDFREVMKVLKKVLAGLDHKNLNALPFFRKHNATAEWIAFFVYRAMKQKIKGIRSVTVWEGLEHSVIYTE